MLSHTAFSFVFGLILAHPQYSTVLDGVFILIVDLLSGNVNCAAVAACIKDKASSDCLCAEGDAFKLYYSFLRQEGSGVVGIIITVVAYFCLLTVSLVFFFNYLVSLHFNGRVIDLFRRLSATEEAFFLPGDLEISSSELRWITSKANRWRGPDGSKRKITVSEFTLTDPLVPGFQEKSTHLAIYHLGVDDSRTLYRQFLRHADGAVVEVFGTMLTSVGSEFAALEKLMLKAGALEEKEGNESKT